MDSVSAEIDLYAAWDPVNYNVVFVNGTETLADTTKAVYGQSFRLPLAETLGISIPQGSSFTGLSVVSGSDTVYYRDGQEITTGLTGENGGTVYLYAVIQKDVSYTVTLPASGDGYKVYYNGGELTAQSDIKVNRNEDVSFGISVESGYSPDKMTVLANGIMLGATQINGRTYSYNIKNVSADTSVSIYNVKKESFRIILNDGTGYSVSPKSAVVESGNDFTFKVTLSEGYKTAVPVVFVNGTALNGIKNNDVFTYTVSEVTAQPVISVSVVPRPQHTVTFVSNGIFDPNGEITRAEFTAIAMRFVDIDVNGSNVFDDVPQSHWAAKDISDAAFLGWIAGNDDGTFRPNTSITRAAVAKIVNNMLGREADTKYIHDHPDSVNLFGDVSVSDWFYADVVEATNAHEYEKNDGIESWK